MKTGKCHLNSLRDGRDVYIYGQRVDDVTSHPAFRNSVASAASLYDFQSAPENARRMTFELAAGRQRVSRAWQLPASYGELVERRDALVSWAETHYGFMGRSPDHVASCLAGMYMGIAQFEASDGERAAALRSYFHYARENDLFLTYAIVNPQADRAKAPSAQPCGSLAAHLVGKDSQGIIVTGAKMLATSAIMANEVFVTTIQPLAPGDERYALSFAIPMNTPGLKILSRKSYEAEAGSVFDNPLASRYDENDAVLYFNDMKVPWERVFIAGDIQMCQKQFFATPAHVFQNYQCQIRLVVKVRFLVGLAQRIAAANGTEAFPQVRETLGQLAAEAACVEAFVMAMEVKGSQLGDYYVPDRHTLYAAQVLTQQLYPKIIHTLRELAGGSMIMLPSGIADLNDPQISDYVLLAQGSASMSPQDRVKFFKLAWDAVGSEFASRHTQYEMFYAGAGFVTKGHSYRTYDWESSASLVDGLLSSYDLPRDRSPVRELTNAL
jgi:4-hydroxyphenylacetate 3-monooxygenase